MRTTIIAALFLTAGCATTNPAVAPGVKLREDTRPQCEATCRDLEMRLAAIVLIQSSAGCVCEPFDTLPAPRTSSRSRIQAGAVAASGGAIIVAANEEADRRRREEQQRQEDEERQRREEEQRERERNATGP